MHLQLPVYAQIEPERMWLLPFGLTSPAHCASRTLDAALCIRRSIQSDDLGHFSSLSMIRQIIASPPHIRFREGYPGRQGETELSLLGVEAAVETILSCGSHDVRKTW